MRPTPWRSVTPREKDDDEDEHHGDDDNDDDDDAWLKRTLVDLFVALLLLFVWCIASPRLAANEFHTVTHAFRVVKVGGSPSLPVPLPSSSYRRYGLNQQDGDGGGGGGGGGGELNGAPCIVLVPGRDDEDDGTTPGRNGGLASTASSSWSPAVAVWEYAVVYFKNEIFDSATRLKVVLVAAEDPTSSTTRDYRLVFWNGDRIVAETVRRFRDDDERRVWDLTDLEVACGGYKGVVGVAVWQEHHRVRATNDTLGERQKGRGGRGGRGGGGGDGGRRGGGRGGAVDGDERENVAVAFAVGRASAEARLPFVRLAGQWWSGDPSDRARWSNVKLFSSGSKEQRRRKGGEPLYHSDFLH